MFIRDSRRSYRTYPYSELILITDSCLFETPIGVTELILIQRYFYTYWYLYLSQISRRSLQNLYLYYGVYTCSEVPVGITEITERILVLRNLFLYGSTRKYYLFKCPKRRTLVLIQRYLNTYWYLYLFQISRRSLQNSYLSYRIYICSEVPIGITEITECILILQNLSLYESTRRYY